jgi:hypothetical protein
MKFAEKKKNSWLQNLGLLGYFSGNCKYCLEGKVSLVSDKSYSNNQVVRRCSNGKCNKKMSIRCNRWFENPHLTFERIVKLTYYWVHQVHSDFIARELRINSEHTLVDKYDDNTALQSIFHSNVSVIIISSSGNITYTTEMT